MARTRSRPGHTLMCAIIPNPSAGGLAHTTSSWTATTWLGFEFYHITDPGGGFVRTQHPLPLVSVQLTPK